MLINQYSSAVDTNTEELLILTVFVAFVGFPFLHPRCWHQSRPLPFFSGQILHFDVRIILVHDSCTVTENEKPEPAPYRSYLCCYS